MTYLSTKFKVAMSNGLGGDAFTRKVTEGHTDGRRTDFDTKLIYPFFLKKKVGIITKWFICVIQKLFFFCCFFANH